MSYSEESFFHDFSVKDKMYPFMLLSSSCGEISTPPLSSTVRVRGVTRSYLIRQESRDIEEGACHGPQKQTKSASKPFQMMVMTDWDAKNNKINHEETREGQRYAGATMNKNGSG